MKSRLGARLGRLAIVAVVASMVISARRAGAQRADTAAHDSLHRVASARLHGTVTRADDQAPVGRADVRLISLDRHTQTDSAGAFRFDGLPAGRILVEVRGVGFDVRRDTVSLENGKDVVRRFSLT